MKLAVAFLLATTPDTELVTALTAADKEAAALVAALVAALPDTGADVPEAVAEAAAEELPVCTAGPTSGCFPGNGSVLSPQLEPAELKVLPYMRQIL